MKAMVLTSLCNMEQNRTPLTLMNMPRPHPASDQLLVRVTVCGVCHTELDEIEGRTPPPYLPIIPGHQIVGKIEEIGRSVKAFDVGERVGIAWISSACGRCKFCRSHHENLCPEFKATGRDVHGGYAEFMTVPEGFAYRIPEDIADVEAAPLLCAGAIGYRSLRLTGLQDGQNLGLTGFGASGHLVMKMARSMYPASKIFVFARSLQQREFAMQLGACWSGETLERAPERLDCIIDTTPAWSPVVAALENLEPGGRLVINAIGKEERDKSALVDLDYQRHLWMEKEIKSVANICRTDVVEFLSSAAAMGLRPETRSFALEDANIALYELKTRRIRGAKVLRV